MSNVKPRYLKQPVTLKTATNEEVFTEFMKRVVGLTGGRPACYFVDAFNNRKQYDIRHASDDLPSEMHNALLKSNEF